MSPLARAAVLAYVVVLLGLAALGATSQLRFREQARLLSAKERAIVDLAAARSSAASVNGPLAVTAWARAAGMVPAPDAPRIEPVAGGLLPPAPPVRIEPWLEVVTVWR